MIGNDIVDLAFAGINSRWREQRFLDKLFSNQEQGFILSDGNRFENIWKLWSMKESAYKIVSRADGIVRFNPKDFKCFPLNGRDGYVICQNTFVPTVTETNQKFIQTTAYLKQNWISDVFQVSNTDAEVSYKHRYQHAVVAYAQLMKVSVETIEIIKNEIGVPQFHIQGILQIEQLSLSHHGQFGAWAIAV
ncbi:MAG: 4'-phosphopantetheinyl transferase superfamily protein [Gelidibacter sp.]